MILQNRRLALIGVVTSGLIAACDSRDATEFADAVFYNGVIHTSDPANPTATAVAVTNGRFVYVGNDATAYTGPDTIVFDLREQMAIPGIIDSHSHPGWVALSINSLELADTSTKAAMFASIADVVTNNPDRSVLIGGYWPNEFFDVDGPTRHELDAIEANRPLILYDDWAHSVWVNSAALEQAQIPDHVEDMAPGFAYFQKDASGVPTGWITESAATDFVNKFQTVTPNVEETLLEYLEYYRSVGVSTVLDAGNFGLDREIYAAVARFDKEGRLPVRYHGAYTLFVPSDWTNAVYKLKRLGEDFNSENVRIDTLKIFYDGVLETRTAAVSEDYLDTPGNNGGALLDEQQLQEIILALEEEDLNLHVHAVGDRATNTVLNAVEAVHATLGRVHSIRIAICHLEVVDEADIPRFAELGVIANFTPHWWSGGDQTWLDQGLGDRAISMQRGNSFVGAGAIVTFSSDITDKYEWHTHRADPFLGMQLGHNRQDVGQGANEPVYGPESERVSRANMLAGYTANGAFQLGRSAEFGAIEVGKYADLVVLDENLFEVDRYEIHKIKPVAVVIEGEVVEGSLPHQPRRE